MAKTYALLVGINDYLAVAPLNGCRNDVDRVEEFLRARAGEALSLARLDDREATKAAVVDAFRGHLGQAGVGDTALFWFSGHGSTAPVPRELWHLEPSGRLQTLLCVDSRHGDVTDLLDKELAVLIHEVAARGAHVAVVLDCCHADGGTRGGEAGVRTVPPLSESPPLDGLLPELRPRDGRPVPAYLAPGGAPDHVLLAACHSHQNAHERKLGGRDHGLFSWALLAALRQLGPGATYRELLTAARCTVENLHDRQAPRLYPAHERLVDQPFLGGRLSAPAAAMVMRYVRGGWEIDAGQVHGIPVGGVGDDETRVGVHGSRPVRQARVVRVLTERSIVEPIGWQPDRHRQYRVVLTRVPLPPTTVAVDEAPEVGAAIRTAGPDGGPSPHVRVGAPPELVVSTCSGRMPMHVRGPDGTELTAPTSEVDQVVAELEHIARWRRIKELRNPVSALPGAVDIEVVAARPGELVAPLDRPPLTVDGEGVLRMAYRRGPAGWTAPTAFIRVRNRADRRLYCVLLNLTDRFRIHASLLPGVFVGPGQCAAALDGGLVEFAMPPGRPVRSGSSVTDWLMVLVSETEISAELFHLPRLGEPMRGVPKRAAAFDGVFDRLGLTALHRDIDRPPAAAYDWTTRILPVVTSVPRDA